jgi:methylglyoxal synthase
VTEDANPQLVLVATRHAREEETGHFLRFVREHSRVLKRYTLHCTEGTAVSLLSTGQYAKSEIVRHRAGTEGGMVEVAAMVARNECVAVILLIDPRDRAHEEVLGRVVKRVADRRGIRLVTTYADAVRWALYEALPTPPPVNTLAPWRLRDWKQGTQIGPGSRYIAQRTLALTSHDSTKKQMLYFVNRHVDLLEKYHRILSTGTTGWILKLVYAEPDQQSEYLEEVDELSWKCHLTKTVGGLLPEPHSPTQVNTADLPEYLVVLRRTLEDYTEHATFAGKVIPLIPGREGGDAWLANEILENRCDTILSFHDPLEPLPRVDDISMYEQTSQMPTVLAGCIINPTPDTGWIRGLQREVEEGPGPVLLAQRLREKFGLVEVLIADVSDDIDGDDLGRALCRLCAGYFNRAIQRLRGVPGARVAVSWGWAMRQILEQLEDMRNAQILEDCSEGPSSITWETAIGRFKADDERLTAEKAAAGFNDFFNGRPDQVECFRSSAYVPDLTGLIEEDSALSAGLPYARLILESAAPWNDESGLYKRSGLIRDNPGLFPDINHPGVAGTIGGVLLSPAGNEVPTQLKLVGLNFERMRAAAERGAVVLVCGGKSRRSVVRAALWGRLVSVLVTSRQTGEWLLDQPNSSPHGVALTGTYARVLVEVVEIQQEYIEAVVPAWHARDRSRIPIGHLSPAVRGAVETGKFPLDLLAVVNLSANSVDELNLQDFELAPELDESQSDWDAVMGHG